MCIAPPNTAFITLSAPYNQKRLASTQCYKFIYRVLNISDVLFGIGGVFGASEDGEQT